MKNDQPTPTALQVGEGYGLLLTPGPKHRSWHSAVDAVAAGRTWWLHTSRPNGRPHAMPVWGVAVEERILFSSDPSSVKARNLAQNPHAVVHLESGDDVVIVEGVVRRIDATELPDRFRGAYEAKYGFDFDPSQPEVGLYELDPVKAFAWDEGDFADTAVRWLFGGSGED